MAATSSIWRRSAISASSSSLRAARYSVLSLGKLRCSMSGLLFRPSLAPLELGLARRLRLEGSGRHFSGRLVGGKDNALARHKMIDELQRARLFRSVEDALALAEQHREGHQHQ